MKTPLPSELENTLREFESNRGMQAIVRRRQKETEEHLTVLATKEAELTKKICELTEAEAGGQPVVNLAREEGTILLRINPKAKIILSEPLVS